MSIINQYGDYKSYLKLKPSNVFYNLAVDLLDSGSDNYTLVGIFLHKAIILNNQNQDAKQKLKELVLNNNISVEHCNSLKALAMTELRDCYSDSDLRKKY